METLPSNIHASLSANVLLDFVLPRHFRGSDRRSFQPTPRPAYLTSISKLRQKRSIGSDAREISSRGGRSSYSQVRSLLLIYHPILLLPHGAPRNYAHPSLFFPRSPAMLFSRAVAGLIRTLIRDDLSGLDRHTVDVRARPLIARSHRLSSLFPPSFPLFSRQSI